MAHGAIEEPRKAGCRGVPLPLPPSRGAARLLRCLILWKDQGEGGQEGPQGAAHGSLR